jgi:hypothetical protein
MGDGGNGLEVGAGPKTLVVPNGNGVEYVQGVE